MKKDFSRKLAVQLIPVVLMALIQTGCNVSSAPGPVPEAGGVTPTQVSGYALPSSIEAIPTESSQSIQAKKQNSSFISKMSNVGTIKQKTISDFDSDEVRLKINEESLEHFDIVDGVLQALNQTKYADPKNINQGPYAALVKFEDDEGSPELEKWIVDSSMIVENGKTINLIKAWIDEDDELASVEFKIFEAANAENKYGKWQFDAKINRKDSQKVGYFSAKIDIDESNRSIVLINAKDLGDEGSYGVKGKLILSDDSGQGIIQYPEHNYNEEDNTVTFYDKVTRYAYDQNHLLIDNRSVDSQLSSRSCKDRNQYQDLFLDYNVYDSNGMNIRKSKTYGFSVKLPGSVDSPDKYYWYGAWNGRHGLHGHNEMISLPVGTILQSEDRELPSKEYFFGASYDGHLKKYSYRESSLEEIKGHTFESHHHENFSFVFSSESGGWHKCTGAQNEWDCSSVGSEAFDFNSLKPDAILKRESGFNGHINGVSMELSINESGSGFAGVVPNDGDTAWGWMGHPLFLKYDGIDFHSYSYLFTDLDRWRYELGESSVYELDNYRYELRAHDLKFVVEHNSGDFTVSREIEEVILPNQQAELLASVDFRDRHDSSKTYTFDYLSMGMLDSDSNPVTQGLWDLEGSDGNRYSWSYATEEQPWEKVSFLKDMNGEFVFLDKAIYFAPFDIDGKNMSFIGFDGHLIGMPNFWEMLRDSDGELTPEIQSKIVNLPAGEYLDREDSNISYKIKPRHGYRLLHKVELDDCLVSIEGELDFEGVPSSVDPQVGPVPANVILKVIEGVFL
ncbi:MAG: hypothetical protein KC493_06820 [Bacteriovoracaceae bacterium]|nr:hypothetical protein [Bacteriovoracaceae bacterium]